MIFNTFSYFFLFLLPSAIAFRTASAPWRPKILALSGTLFFVYFSLTAVGGVLGAICLALFLWEATVSRLYKTGSRWCWVGVALALGILAVFKYWNFATGIVWPSGANPWRWSGAFLPLGVSFFTFEFIHYAEDRRLGRTEAGTFWEYLAFILFFPTMVAGPIKRYQDFLPALRAPSPNWAADWERGLTRILVGLAKKFAIADLLTTFTVHLNETDIAAARPWVLPVWLVAFGLQIYFDFSAYSDIAIGSARLFGLPVKENFDWPYLQTDLAAFWRHWHMSLTRWLTDYVYIPLGGSRVGAVRVYANVIAVMLASGLWHGAGANFLVWGLWHGAGLAAHRGWRVLRGESVAGTGGLSVAGRFGAWALTFTYVNVGWAFFIMDLPTAGKFFRHLVMGWH